MRGRQLLRASGKSQRGLELPPPFLGKKRVSDSHHTLRKPCYKAAPRQLSWARLFVSGRRRYRNIILILKTQLATHAVMILFWRGEICLSLRGTCPSKQFERHPPCSTNFTA